jgi:tRNA threonylcarbamoyladenosine biosynthesis protein TsaE
MATEMISNSVEQTESIAAELSGRLGPGDCVALYGELGAGKTQFVRGLVQGLGASGRQVASPTFVLLHIYEGGRLRVFHLDAYRVHGPEDFAGIGFGELLEQGGVVVVEWAERVLSLLPEKRIDVRMEIIDPARRSISMILPDPFILP